MIDARVACPLCGATAPGAASAAGRPIHACPVCDLRFVPAAFHVSSEQERARYKLHRNSPSDAGYVRFLSPVVEALRRALPPEAGGEVLDYGAGPEPVLVGLLRAAGYAASGYDPFFGSSGAAGRACDAVVSTEVFEHFRAPGADIERVVRLVKPGGVLVVMTALYEGQDLATWHYSHDVTHVAFYSAATVSWIARRWRLELLETDGRRLTVLRRTGTDQGEVTPAPEEGACRGAQR